MIQVSFIIRCLGISKNLPSLGQILIENKQNKEEKDASN